MQPGQDCRVVWGLETEMRVLITSLFQQSRRSLAVRTDSFSLRRLSSKVKVLMRSASGLTSLRPCWNGLCLCVLGGDLPVGAQCECWEGHHAAVLLVHRAGDLPAGAGRRLHWQLAGCRASWPSPQPGLILLGSHGGAALGGGQGQGATSLTLLTSLT